MYTRIPKEKEENILRARGQESWVGAMLIGSSHGSSKSTSLGSRKSCSIMPRTIGLRWSSWSEQPALVHTWWTGLSSKLPQRSVHFHCHIIAQKRLLRERLSAISQRINLFNEHCSCSICSICSWNNTKRQWWLGCHERSVMWSWGQACNKDHRLWASIDCLSSAFTPGRV